MADGSSISVVVSGIVAVAGVAIPAISNALTRRGDRAHELLKMKVERGIARRDHLHTERERLYTDWLRHSVRMQFIADAVAKGEDTTVLFEAARPETDDQRHMGARIDAFASDEARPMLKAWGALAFHGLPTELPEGAELETAYREWAARVTIARIALCEQLREELQAMAQNY